MSDSMSDPRPSGALETFRYDNAIVRLFIIATVVWGIVGMLVGVIISLQLAWPAANLDLPWTTYGRLRPLHTNAVIFAFAGNGIFAAIYYSSQRLLKARMFSDGLSKMHFWGWQAIIVAAAITLPLGITQSKEYAELEWPIDIAIAVVWVAFSVNLMGTIIKRRERHLYVAIWFYLATVVAITLLHVVNSLVIPVTLTKSYPVFAGIQDALVQWWYGHNAVAFLLTTPFLGLMYYFLPKAAGRPIYSYRLSILHFWSLIFLYIWAGPHHLLNAATPEWAQTLGVVFSIMLIAPSWGGMINGYLTLRGAYDRLRTDPVIRFFFLGITYYGMVTFEGSLLSLRDVNALSHNTDWTVAHVHNGALGWVGFMLFGMLYWLVPRMWKTELHSKAIANAHFWLATIGIGIYALSMWTAGIIEGLMQLWFNTDGTLRFRGWSDQLDNIQVLYWVRVVAGLFYLTGLVLMAWNLWATARRGTAVTDDEAQAPALLPEVDLDKQVGEALAKSGQAKVSALHGLVERWPMVFLALIAVAILIGSVAEIIPSLIQGALTPRIASVTPYTALELTGRDIYIREGCNNCHTQMIRTLRAEVARYGDYTRPGEHIYDRPHLWGSRRMGPDLARAGTKLSYAWNFTHTRDPRKVDGSHNSTMPRYPWLYVDEMDLSTVERKLSVLKSAPIYTPYTAREVENAEADARHQAGEIAAILRQDLPTEAGAVQGLENKEIIALIAYLKRLGTDLNKPSAGAP